jgi:CDP-4-dehydro-6-deoxyglucose reductase
MALEWVEGVITKIENETSNTKKFYFEIPALEKFDFIPGQFVTLDLPIHEQKNKRWRSYSIASAPSGANTFELVIVHLEGGLGTTHLFNEISVGSKITLRGPQGVFTLPKNFDNDV